ncbi:hypothetical protein M758_12G052300 [Ceratodon purpureus]|uniref:Cyanovirin-N domain-containing protein n=1 Tax=Ceratodon purpureus TaxID=3225 RepID=A0A8T0G4T6_CERPU|nr:hypothetical protein KC19_12G049300 [Ceratodon purpureus]KAG0598171.1 hypothetical protein M758_12G052300 [Ceratodon purpureus]
MVWQRASALAAAGLLCVLALLSGAQAQLQCEGFAASCNTYSFGADGIFRAQCRDHAGRYVAASVNPNPYISNVDGHLIDGANFLESCVASGVGTSENPDVQVRIYATCTKINGALSLTHYDINRKVFNNNGNLVWNNCHRTAPIKATPGLTLAGGGRKLLNA